MTGPAGFLEFFILEAGDYVEQLDGLLLRGSSQGPDAESVQRVARALRGTATMAKLPSFANLAGAVERVGRAMQEGILRWDPALGGALVASIDDLKILLHAARRWSPAEDERAAARSAELARYAPPRGPAVPQGADGQTAQASPFLATEAANIAAGLELLGTRTGDPDMAANVLRRVRALRGVAGVKEVAPLADTLEATEDAARAFETGQTIRTEARELIAAAADYLRTLAAALRAGSDVEAPSAARDRFAAAQEHWSERVGERERVVPIASLFYDDGAPGLLETSPNPPSSPAERFRLELVSLGEHLRQVVDGARSATDATSLARARRDLRRALGAMQASAESFGEREVAAFVNTHLPSADHIDFLGLTALNDLAMLVSAPDGTGERLTDRLREVIRSHDLTRAIGIGFGSDVPKARPSGPRNLIDAMHESERGGTAGGQPAIHEGPGRGALIVNTPAFTAAIPFAPLSAPLAAPPAARTTAIPAETASQQPAPTPVQAAPSTPSAVTPAVPAQPTPPRPVPAPVPAPATPSQSTPAQPELLGEALDQGSAALIDSSLAALDDLMANPFGELVTIPDDYIVPIEALLYRGRAALDRAVEIRDVLRRAGPTSDLMALEELFDLVELARAD